MRILHLLSSNKLSGAENVAADICMMFKNELEMSYCSPDGSIKDALKDREVNFIPLKKLNIFEVRNAIKNFKPDIIHAHDVKATVIATLVSGKIPVVSHLHVNANNMSVISIKSLIYFISSFRVKKIISVSESCLEEYKFKNFIRNKTVVLKNIIYENRLKKLIEKDNKKYDFDFVYLGRLTYQKNPERVAKVASQVLKKCQDARFGVIGEGELKSEMEKIFREEGVIDRVTFTGRLPYPYKALKSAKCMLMCSRYEGLPIAILEAMALGVPIVSTPVDGITDLVENGVEGFLTSDDEKLAESVQSLLENNELFLEMSSNSITSFNEFNNESDYRNRLSDIYIKVINISLCNK
ncbi:glycosyltransferase [Caloramator proteoclasticus]|uniref:Glycosyltransferase involved in cell wall bisynthesis n=1 Tax=Caloramator proteoclasticus DSM 10124 TaxID=1121262 RepID=A0A1M4WL18_9CLOT|nr:glycosyltransferase [Caloramator proteoclasticus]SHE81959.1 Glycosyltransferase involved in cell wall bisynthesis [Caloramator proteoclasticus DSM 10124]